VTLCYARYDNGRAQHRNRNRAVEMRYAQSEQRGRRRRKADPQADDKSVGRFILQRGATRRPNEQIADTPRDCGDEQQERELARQQPVYCRVGEVRPRYEVDEYVQPIGDVHALMRFAQPAQEFADSRGVGADVTTS